ncbi:MAG: PadR family transcriptional regulator [Candidatus Cloacimonetes bacterium]|nr:PadR family transcriptional regulator [Candidatus Cloacimonadota bacterium]MCF7813596.1 PadR family transcriptional regulator [Candidatus Cloacimonadota bacterium]MCF7867912.1 PadR family transcriptional regulator [Candidatus Cloacimonadota bacterium]MCF7882895.1 PadR family transcriptional regulator [Candidatus Cloacimonadota bacterium]
MSRVDLVVLGLLKHQPMHGYKIVSFFEKRGLTLWTRVKTASVYKALQRLEKHGFIVGKKKQEDNNPPKKVFTITASGKKKFMEILRYYLFQEDVRNSPMDFWNAVRFIRKNISRDEFIRALDNHEKCLNEHVQMMKKKHHKNLSKKNMDNLPFYAKIMMNKMKKIFEMEINTISEMRKAALKPENQNDFAEEE